LLTPASAEVARERISDLLRQAEHHRLIKTALRARKERRRAQRHQRREARAAARRLTTAPVSADQPPVAAQESS